MSPTFLSPPAFWQHLGFTIIRMITGLLMVYHGWEVFDSSKMEEYGNWDMFKNYSSHSVWFYLGKGAEIVGGILLALGWFTRFAALMIAVVMLYISFFIGNGKVWSDSQHPFLFVLLALLFFFTGGGPWSIDALFFSKSKRKTQI